MKIIDIPQGHANSKTRWNELHKLLLENPKMAVEVDVIGTENLRQLATRCLVTMRTRGLQVRTKVISDKTVAVWLKNQEE
jgi:hypothetical protein